MKQLIPLILITLLAFNLSAQKAEDEKAIHQVLQTMLDGWNTGDGEKFASVFAEAHDFVVWTGYYFKDNSVARNAETHNQIFSTMYKDTENFAVIDKVRFIRDEVAMIHVLSAVVKKGEERPENPEVLFSAVLEKQDGVWKILSFHNLDLEVFQNERIKQASPVPVEVMYASWYAEGKG